MNFDMKLNLANINLKEQKTPIFIIVAILITLFFGKKIWDSNSAKSRIINKKIINYENQIELANEINMLSKKFDEFRSMGWQTEESVSIMGAINKFVSKYDLEIFSFDPGSLKKEKKYLTFAMTLSVGADYFDLLKFLSEIEELGALTKIINLRITPTIKSESQEYGPMVRANFTIQAFIFKK